MFRDLLRVKLPRLSQHLHHLQKAANREAGGTTAPPPPPPAPVFSLARCQQGLSLRKLRAAADQRLHHAVVPHHVRHLPADAHRAEDLGLGLLRGLRSSVPRGAGHLGAAGRVSIRQWTVCVCVSFSCHLIGRLTSWCLCVYVCVCRRIEDCQSADEFYSTMGCLTQEMLEHSLVDSVELMQA